MTTLVVHPGSPKTATSTLQHILRSNRALLAERGIGLVLPEDLRSRSYFRSYFAVYRGISTQDLSEATAELFAPYAGKFDKVICTEETFCHDFMPSRTVNLGGIDGAAIAADVLSKTGFESTEIVLTIRPQADLLTSSYTHSVHRRQESRPFKDWLDAEVDLDRVLWQPAVQAFRNRFGDDRVKVISMDMARETSMVGYLQTVLRAMTGDEIDLPVTEEKVHNPSPSARAVQLCRVMNEHIVHKKKSGAVNTCLVAQFPAAEFGKFASGWAPPQALVDSFHEDHRAALQNG